MAADTSEEQKQLIQIAAKLGFDILATGGAFTNEEVTDASVTTLFTRLGTQYVYTIASTLVADVAANTAKVTNATHTGDVTGATVLTFSPVAISSKALKSALVGTEELLINDAGTLKKTTSQDIVDLGGGGIFGSEFEIFQSLAQTNTGALSTDKVDATSALKPAGTYRIGFYCDITNSDGTDIWNVQFLVNGTPIHQHTNGGDLYENKPDGNNDWSSESSVNYITLASPATIDMNIKFGTNDNTARAANATIEIWRVS